jgi:hypothetical protein
VVRPVFQIPEYEPNLPLHRDILRTLYVLAKHSTQALSICTTVSLPPHHGPHCNTTLRECRPSITHRSPAKLYQASKHYLQTRTVSTRGRRSSARTHLWALIASASVSSVKPLPPLDVYSRWSAGILALSAQPLGERLIWKHA